MIVEIKQFRLVSWKIESKKIYTFKNDVEINYLSEQLCTIKDFNLGSHEQNYSKAEEHKLGIDEKTAKLKNCWTRYLRINPIFFNCGTCSLSGINPDDSIQWSK